LKWGSFGLAVALDGFSEAARDIARVEEGMRRFVVVSFLSVGALLAGLEAALAQSGVFGGPPQVYKGPGTGPSYGPNSGPNYGPNSGPNYGPNAGPNLGPSAPVEPEMRGGRDGSGWIAVAGGFDGRGKNVGVGFSGQQYSRIEAENSALNACNRRGRGIRCQQAYAVPNGCLYIVPGSGRRGVTWGRGSTPEVALQECRRNGYSCDRGKVIGGCSSGYGN
jgi:hypothetical protein